MSLPFPSLDFQGRTTLTVNDIANKLRYTPEHVIGLIECGELVSVNGSRSVETRMSYRVPIEAYREFIRSRMTAPFKETCFSKLTLTQLMTLAGELQAAIATKREVEKHQTQLFEDA